MKRAAVVVSVLLFAGCSGSSSEVAESTLPHTTVSETTTTVVETTTTVAETTTTTLAVDFGEQYLSIVCRTNRESSNVQNLVSRFEDRYGYDGVVGSFDNWAARPDGTRANYAGVEVARNAFIRAVESLLTSDWPPEVQEDIEHLAEDMAADARWYSWLADATTGEAFWSIYDVQRPIDQYPSAPTRIRARLGLPSNLGDENGC